MRLRHKLRALPKTKEEFILCKGREDRFEVVRFFFANVNCPDCLKMRHQKVSTKKKLRR